MSRPPLPHRLLIRLHPKRHRLTYAEEMLAVLEHRYRTVGRSSWARLRLHVETFMDLAWSAVTLWVRMVLLAVHGASRGTRNDFHFVLRSLSRSPGYATTAVLVVAGAVATNTTVVSFLRGTLLSPPPYRDPANVVLVWGSATSGGQLRDVISGPNLIDFSHESHSLERIAAFHEDASYLTGEGHPEVVGALEVSVDFLDVLGVQPMLGRDFDERDRTSSAPATVLVSYTFWRDRLHADPDVIGRPLGLEGSPHTILGVLPEGFDFSVPAPLYLPLRDDVLAADNRGRIHYNAVGRLAAGASATDVSVELSEILRRISRQYGMYEGWSVLAEPLQRVSVEAVRPVIVTLTVTVGLVLLIALVNLATLFRVRSAARRDDLHVRLALGSGRWRAARLLLMEATGLAVLGAVIGLGASPLLLGWVTDVVPLWIPIPGSASSVPVLRGVLDGSVAGVVLASAVLGALVLTVPGVMAAIRSCEVDARRVHAGVRGTRVLVAVELATATVLCLGAALTTRSASRLLSTEVGVRDQGLLTLHFGDRWEKNWEVEDPASVLAYFREVVAEVEELPGVVSAALMDYVDFEGEDDYARIYFLDRSFQPASNAREQWRRVGFGLFETAGMPMRAGRSLTREDFEVPARSAVVNEAFARRYFPKGEAVGHLISTHLDRYQGLTIVGVVADVRSLGPGAPAPPMVYLPMQGAPRGTQGLYVRVSGEPMAYAGAVRDAIWAVDPSQPVADLRPMAELVGSWVAIPRATRSLLTVLALLSLLLSAVGVFGVVAYAVRSRRGELGVRLALGASPGRLGRDLAWTIAPVAAAGLGIGLLLGILAARAARSVLYGVSPVDAISMASSLLIMGSSLLLAVYLPARRVTRIHPVEAIRAE